MVEGLLRACLRLSVLALLAATTATGTEEGVGRGGLALGSVLGGEENSGFERILGPAPLSFPEDHGPHERQRSEWWYLVAHLEDVEGRRYGVQFTVFRQGLVPVGPGSDSESASAWRASSIYMAHLGLAEEAASHVARERFARGAVGMAGAEAAPFRVWLDDWQLASLGDAFLPLELEAFDGGGQERLGARLRLEHTRPLVLQGDAGYSRKSEDVGNASRYYSHTRLVAEGTLLVAGETRAVRGLAWLDREWSTSSLAADQAGWDWFALHLEDGRDLMLYRMRKRDGTVDRWSAGLLVEADGSARRLAPDDWVLEPRRWWTDSAGSRWPVEWHLQLPGFGIDGMVRPLLDDQVNDLSVRYWEGRVELDGTVPGTGFLELTGY